MVVVAVEGIEHDCLRLLVRHNLAGRAILGKAAEAFLHLLDNAKPLASLDAASPILAVV